MGHAGLFALGASLVWLAKIVLKTNYPSRGHGIVVLALLPLVGAGAAVLLHPSLNKSADYFPIGMLLAFCWFGMEEVLPGLASTDAETKRWSKWKLGAAIVLSVLLLVLPAVQFLMR